MLGSVPDIHSLRAPPYNTFPDVLTSDPETVGDRRCADVCAVLNRMLMLLFIRNIGEDYLVMVCEQSHTQIHAYRLALWLQTSKWRSLNSLWNGHGPCFHVEFRECITPSISLYHVISLYQYIFIYRHGRSK